MNRLNRLKTGTWLPLLLAVAVAPGAAARDAGDLYRQGYAAFERNDCPTAVKYLFAYLQVERPDARVASPVHDAIRFCDERIAYAISVQQQLDQYGQVLVVTSSGKADDMGGVSGARRPVPFRKPPPPRSRRPVLPGQAPVGSGGPPPGSVHRAPPSVLTGPRAMAPGMPPSPGLRLRPGDAKSACAKRVEGLEQALQRSSEKIRRLQERCRRMEEAWRRRYGG